jgi:hypothetical protein
MIFSWLSNVVHLAVLALRLMTECVDTQQNLGYMGEESKQYKSLVIARLRCSPGTFLVLLVIAFLVRLQASIVPPINISLRVSLHHVDYHPWQ